MQNDKDLGFDTEKMKKITVFFSSAILALFFYFGFVSKAWDKENRGKHLDYYTNRNFNILRLKLPGTGLDLRTNQDVLRSYLNLNPDINLYKLEKSVSNQ